MSMEMENLYRIRDAHKKINEKEEVNRKNKARNPDSENLKVTYGAVDPITGKEMELGEQDKTLAEILQNKDEHARFLAFCADNDPIRSYPEGKLSRTEEIAEILADTTGEKILSEDHDAFLEQMRRDYNLRRAKVERIKGALPNEIKSVAKVDPRIQEVVGKIGLDKAGKLLSREFEELAMSNSEKFSQLAEHLHHFIQIRDSKELADLNADVRSTLEKYGIKQEEYWEATKPGQHDWQVKAQLEKLVLNNYSGFRKAIGFGNKYAQAGAKELLEVFETQQKFLAEADGHLKEVGKILQGTLNPKVRFEIQQRMEKGGEVKAERVANDVETIQDYRSLKVNQAPEAIKRRYDTELQAAQKEAQDAGETFNSEAFLESFAEKQVKARERMTVGKAFKLLVEMLFPPRAEQKEEIKRLVRTS